MDVLHKRYSACSYQKASANGIANHASSTLPRKSRHNSMQWPSTQRRAFSPIRNVVQSRHRRPHVDAMRVFVADVVNATFPFRRPRLSAAALRWHRVSFTSHLNLKRRSNHCCRVQMHLMHVAVAPSPPPNARSNGRHTLHFLRESFCAKPKPGHVCR